MSARCCWRLANFTRFCTLKCQTPSLVRSSRLYTTAGAASGDKTTHFGFETVSEKEKEEKVYNVFHNVADTYDLMNDVMSGGIHRLWKDYFMWRMCPVPGTQLLDVAGGTGDIAFRFLKFVENQLEKDSQNDSFSALGRDRCSVRSDYDAGSLSDDAGSTVDSKTDKMHVTVCDINQAMLDVGKSKARRLGYQSGISWLRGNAESLPVADNSFDVYSVAFGIRNMTHIDKVLSEAHRVLRPGGRFLCLEFSEVANPLLKTMYDGYSFQVIPVMGQLIAGDWKSYQYLVESIRKFPNQETFKSLIEDAGFQCVEYENLMFGVAAIHSGIKL